MMMVSDSSGTVLGSEGAQNEGGSGEKSEDGEFHSGLLLAMKVIMGTTGLMRAGLEVGYKRESETSSLKSDWRLSKGTDEEGKKERC